MITMNTEVNFVFFSYRRGVFFSADSSETSIYSTKQFPNEYPGWNKKILRRTIHKYSRNAF